VPGEVLATRGAADNLDRLVEPKGQAVVGFVVAGMATPELDARLLLCHAAGLSHEAYVDKGRDLLRPEAAENLGAAIARRLKHGPVARILGMRED